MLLLLDAVKTYMINQKEKTKFYPKQPLMDRTLMSANSMTTVLKAAVWTFVFYFSQSYLWNIFKEGLFIPTCSISTLVKYSSECMTISYPPCKKGIRPGICEKPAVSHEAGDIQIVRAKCMLQQKMGQWMTWQNTSTKSRLLTKNMYQLHINTDRWHICTLLKLWCIS